MTVTDHDLPDRVLQMLLRSLTRAGMTRHMPIGTFEAPGWRFNSQLGSSVLIRNPGLRALLNTAGISTGGAKFAFRLAPLIYAAGRIEHAPLFMHLLAHRTRRRLAV